MSHQVVMLRHGHSDWNLKNLFTGWADVDLSPRGVEEAKAAGKTLLDEGIEFDIAFTSLLTRAIRTLWLTMDVMDRMWVPVIRAWELNERHYGDLEGRNRGETMEKHGAEQVRAWRRGYATTPPPMDENDKRHPRFDPRYANIDPALLPAGESLATTLDRVKSYWDRAIVPEIRSGKTVLIAAHGNSLRALVKMLDNVSDDEITGFNIPTGIPMLYELDADLNSNGWRYLGDPEAAALAAAEAMSD